MEFKHIPVLLNETIKGLNIKPDGIYVDGTIGGAGHSKKIIEKLSAQGFLIGIDRDEEALKAAKENLKGYNIAGPSYFTYNGKLITEIAEETQWKEYRR